MLKKIAIDVEVKIDSLKILFIFPNSLLEFSSATSFEIVVENPEDDKLQTSI